MKKKVIGLLSMFLIATISVFAQSKTEKFKVYGNCGVCESRIEKAAMSVKGVTKADWDKKTKMITVTFDESLTSLDKVHLAISEAGHDTDKRMAKDEAYNQLPGCCKYDRADSGKKGTGKVKKVQ